MASIRPNLRERIINDPAGVKAEIGTQIGTQGVHDVPIISNPTPSVKPEQLQESGEAPLSKPIAYNFLFLKGANLNQVLPLADLGEPGEALCDKCKLKDAEGGRVEGRSGDYKGEGFMLITCVNQSGNTMVTAMDDSFNQW